jgi:RimJ/RimL family protein N-acetyltransferase
VRLRPTLTIWEDMNDFASRSAGDVSLRDVAEGDLEIFFLDQLDPEATRMAAFPSREKDAFAAHWARILGDETVIAKSIVVEGEVAGNVMSWMEGGEREVGYWVGKSYWGRGIATRTLSEFLQEVPDRPLFAHVAKHNLGSLRVLAKCGFAVAEKPANVSAGEGRCRRDPPRARGLEDRCGHPAGCAGCTIFSTG